jgi:hypothetical protein
LGQPSKFLPTFSCLEEPFPANSGGAVRKVLMVDQFPGPTILSGGSEVVVVFLKANLKI